MSNPLDTPMVPMKLSEFLEGEAALFQRVIQAEFDRQIEADKQQAEAEKIKDWNHENVQRGILEYWRLADPFKYPKYGAPLKPIAFSEYNPEVHYIGQSLATVPNTPRGYIQQLEWDKMCAEM
jgi:hypothetical protein